jgi:hypothetical protein
MQQQTRYAKKVCERKVCKNNPTPTQPLRYAKNEVYKKMMYAKKGKNEVCKKR